MRWASIRIPINGLDYPDAEQAASSLLLCAGTQGVALAVGAYDEVSSVTGYLPEDERLPSSIRQIEAALHMLPSIGVVGVGTEPTVAFVEEEDWANAWKQYFKPIRIGRHFVVTPPWEDAHLKDNERALVIDPGMAFGTGTHPTTQLCLACLEDYVQPEGAVRVADIGTGSGILAIAAKKLGAQYVLAIDTDPMAVRIAETNAKVNDVSIDSRTLDSIPDWHAQPFDMVVANILADTLIGLAEQFAEAVKHGGIYIASGVIEGREDNVRLLTEAEGFQAIETRYQGEWVALVFRRVE
jgi:ribosomal protein L11 methyltransferase